MPYSSDFPPLILPETPKRRPQKKKSTVSESQQSHRQPYHTIPPPRALHSLKGHEFLPASLLPEGFPPELAYRALAAYSLLRTLSVNLRLSPFTPNVFLRALFLPYPNRLLGQVHVSLLRILLPQLHMGYSFRQHGSAVSKKRKVDGARVQLRAGDNLTYLDGLTWPLFYDDYCNLTADILWSLWNDPDLRIDHRVSEVKNNQSTGVSSEHGGNAVVDTAIEDEAGDLHPLKPRTARKAATKATIVDIDSDSDQEQQDIISEEDVSDYEDQGDEGSPWRKPAERRRPRKKAATGGKRGRPPKQRAANIPPPAPSSQPKSVPPIQPQFSPINHKQDFERTNGKQRQKNFTVLWSSPTLRPMHQVQSEQPPHKKPRTEFSTQKSNAQITMHSVVTAAMPVPHTTSKKPREEFSTPAAPMFPNSDSKMNVNPVSATGMSEDHRTAAYAESQQQKPIAAPSPDIYKREAPTLKSTVPRPPGYHPTPPPGYHPLALYHARRPPPSGVRPIASQPPSYHPPPGYRPSLHHSSGHPPPPPQHSVHRPFLPHPPGNQLTGNQPRPTEPCPIPSGPSIPKHNPAFPLQPPVREPPVHKDIKVKVPEMRLPTKAGQGYKVADDIADALEDFITGGKRPKKNEEQKYNHFQIKVPQGMLGLILDDKDGYVATVTEIKNSSPLVTQVREGDQLVSVDGVDIAGMLKSEVSQLIVSKMYKPIRAFVFRRPQGDSSTIDKSYTSNVEILKEVDLQTKITEGSTPALDEGHGTDVHETQSPEQTPVETSSAPVDDMPDLLKQWPQLEPVRCMRAGVSYHRLSMEHKLQILEFLLDELLTVDHIAAEFTVRHTRTAYLSIPYGTLPSEAELAALTNEDFCGICELEGDLLCCDGCPLSYHRRCIGMSDYEALPDGKWMCPECTIIDPAKFGPLRGGKKCSLDWFSLEDLGVSDNRADQQQDGKPSIPETHHFPAPSSTLAVSRLDSMQQTLPTDGDALDQKYAVPDQFEVRATPGALGLILQNGADNVVIVTGVKRSSPLATQVHVGDQLVSVDGYETKSMAYSDVVKLISSRMSNPTRVLVFERPQRDSFDQFEVRAPPGVLGIILENTHDDVATITQVKSTSPLVGQVRLGDQLVAVDGNIVVGMKYSEVSKLIASKMRNASRVFVFKRPQGRALVNDKTLTGAGTLQIADTGAMGASSVAQIQECRVDEMEYLVVHGFMFARDSLLGKMAKNQDKKENNILPVAQPQLHYYLQSLGPSTASLWPFSQIPFKSEKVLGVQDKNRTDPFGTFFRTLSSFDPSSYHCLYRMAPLSRFSKIGKGSKNKSLMFADYESECSNSDTRHLSHMMSWDMLTDKTIARALRTSTMHYNPYHLVSNYILRLEKNTRKAGLLHEQWETQKNVYKWQTRVTNCRSIRRLAKFLVELVNATHLRAFLADWHSLSGTTTRNTSVTDEVTSTAQNQRLPPDWTTEDELRKRKWERSLDSNLLSMLSIESEKLGDAIGAFTKRGQGTQGRKKKNKTSAGQSGVVGPSIAPNFDEKQSDVASTQQEQSGALMIDRGESDGNGIFADQAQSTVSKDVAAASCPDGPQLPNDPPRSLDSGALVQPSPAEISTKDTETTTPAFPMNTGLKSNDTSAAVGTESVNPTLKIDVGESDGNMYLEEQISKDGPTGVAAASCPDGPQLPNDPPRSLDSGALVQPSPAVINTKGAESTARAFQTNEGPESNNTHAIGANGSMNPRPDVSLSPALSSARQENTIELSNQDQSCKKANSKTKKKSRTRQRRSGRLQHRSEDELNDPEVDVGSSGVNKNAARNSMAASVKKQRNVKLKQMEELVKAPFVKEFHWPLAGRKLFDPEGSLASAEMKRLARCAGRVTAPFLCYNTSYEVARAATCHVWRKKTLQSSTLEELLFQIRTLDSFVDKNVLNTCESLNRKAAANKLSTQEVIRCTQRDLKTGIVYHFVTSKSVPHGGWISSESIDLPTLVLYRAVVFDAAQKRQANVISDAASSNVDSKMTQPPGAGGIKLSPLDSDIKPYSAKANVNPPKRRGRPPKKKLSSAPAPTLSTPLAGDPISLEVSRCQTEIKNVLLQHESDTTTQLLRAFKLGRQVLDETAMAEVRKKNFAPLHVANLTLQRRGMPFNNEAAIGDQLSRAEISAATKFGEIRNKLASEIKNASAKLSTNPTAIEGSRPDDGSFKQGTGPIQNFPLPYLPGGDRSSALSVPSTAGGFSSQVASDQTMPTSCFKGSGFSSSVDPSLEQFPMPPNQSSMQQPSSANQMNPGFGLSASSLGGLSSYPVSVQTLPMNEGVTFSANSHNGRNPMTSNQTNRIPSRQSPLGSGAGFSNNSNPLPMMTNQSDTFNSQQYPLGPGAGLSSNPNPPPGAGFSSSRKPSPGQFAMTTNQTSRSTPRQYCLGSGAGFSSNPNPPSGAGFSHNPKPSPGPLPMSSNQTNRSTPRQYRLVSGAGFSSNPNPPPGAGFSHNPKPSPGPLPMSSNQTNRSRAALSNYMTDQMGTGTGFSRPLSEQFTMTSNQESVQGISSFRQPLSGEGARFSRNPQFPPGQTPLSANQGYASGGTFHQASPSEYSMAENADFSGEMMPPNMPYPTGLNPQYQQAPPIDSNVYNPSRKESASWLSSGTPTQSSGGKSSRMDWEPFPYDQMP